MSSSVSLFLVSLFVLMNYMESKVITRFHEIEAKLPDIDGFDIFDAYCELEEINEKEKAIDNIENNVSFDVFKHFIQQSSPPKYSSKKKIEDSNRDYVALQVYVLCAT